MRLVSRASNLPCIIFWAKIAVVSGGGMCFVDEGVPETTVSMMQGIERASESGQPLAAVRTVCTG